MPNQGREGGGGHGDTHDMDGSPVVDADANGSCLHFEMLASTTLPRTLYQKPSSACMARIGVRWGPDADEQITHLLTVSAGLSPNLLVGGSWLASAHNLKRWMDPTEINRHQTRQTGLPNLLHSSFLLLAPAPDCPAPVSMSSFLLGATAKNKVHINPPLSFV